MFPVVGHIVYIARCFRAFRLEGSIKSGTLALDFCILLGGCFIFAMLRMFRRISKNIKRTTRRFGSPFQNRAGAQEGLGLSYVELHGGVAGDRSDGWHDSETVPNLLNLPRGTSSQAEMHNERDWAVAEEETRASQIFFRKST